MENAIKAVYQWQKDAGNLDMEYSDFLQSSFQVEEALEGFSDHQSLCNLLARECDISNDSPKEMSRYIISLVMQREDLNELTDVERFDKHVDSIIYNIGALGQLNLSPQQINAGILAVNHANKQKLNAPRDEHGKLGKPTNFVDPHEALQQILNKRTNP